MIRTAFASACVIIGIGVFAAGLISPSRGPCTFILPLDPLSAIQCEVAYGWYAAALIRSDHEITSHLSSFPQPKALRWDSDNRIIGSRQIVISDYSQLPPPHSNIHVHVPDQTATCTFLAAPGWALTGIAWTWPAACLSAWFLRWRRTRRPGICTHCGYNLTGNISGVCPECGTTLR